MIQHTDAAMFVAVTLFAVGSAIFCVGASSTMHPLDRVVAGNAFAFFSLIAFVMLLSGILTLLLFR